MSRCRPGPAPGGRRAPSPACRPRVRRAAQALGVAAALAAPLAPAGAGQLRGLAIGIDDYVRLMPLRGAGNDARDIAAALRQAGATDVTTLLDARADRDGILKAWRALLARAAPDDTLVLSFSGHGGREPERRPGLGGGDGMEEPLMLAAFTEQKPGNYQRLFDREVGDMVRAAGGRNLVLLIDACHSGTPTREVVRAPALPVRWGNYGPIEDDALPPPPRPLAATDVSRAAPGAVPDAPRGRGPTPDPGSAATDLPANAVIVGASLDTQNVVEILWHGQAHGAASVLLARALRGEADSNRDGALQAGELKAFMIEGVRTLTEARQEATVEFQGAPTRVLLGAAPTAAAAPVLPPASSTAPAAPPSPLTAPLPFAISGASPTEEPTLLAGLARIAAVPPAQATLVWDQPRGRLVSAHGDVVAEARGAAQVQAIVDKWRLLGWLGSRPRTPPLALRLGDGDRAYRVGERVDIAVPLAGAQLLLLNLAPDGTVQLLYPLGADEAAQRLPPQGVYRLPGVRVSATDGFGAEHLVALSADHLPDAWLAALRDLDGTPGAAPLLQDLDAWLRARPDVAVGQVGLYSQP